jgi:hypothetical protein
MKAQPPRVIESLLAFLIPAVCREHVLGDLHERFTSLRQYIGDGVRTVPYVILSRIRRVIDMRVLLMEASALYFSFVSAAWRLEGVAFLHEQRAFLRLTIPNVVALLVLIAGDAYSDPGFRKSPLGRVLGAMVGVGSAFLSEVALSAVNAKLALPRWVVLSGSTMGIVLVSALRILFPRNTNRPRGAT